MATHAKGFDQFTSITFVDWDGYARPWRQIPTWLAAGEARR
jgi:uncharacterized membrane protein